MSVGKDIATLLGHLRDRLARVSNKSIWEILLCKCSLADKTLRREPDLFLHKHKLHRETIAKQWHGSIDAEQPEDEASGRDVDGDRDERVLRTENPHDLTEALRCPRPSPGTPASRAVQANHVRSVSSL